MYNNYFKKNIIWLFLFVVLFFSTFVFAWDDCKSIDVSLDPNLIFTQEDIDLARSHLLAYCCRENEKLFKAEDFLSTWQCKTATAWPDSPYWYDHLIDIGMRKLSGRKDEIYPEMDLDKDAKEWQDFLSNSEKAKNPVNVSEEYKKHWKLNDLPVVDNLSDSLNKFYATTGITLHDKYTNLCMVALGMYKNISNIDIVKDWYYSKCVSLASMKINEETLFTVAISQNSAANMLSDSWTSYTNHFLQDRLMKLRDKMVAISSYFNILLKKAPLSKDCQK